MNDTKSDNVMSRNAIVQKLNKMDRYVSTELRLCDTDKIFPQNEVFIVDDVYEEIVEQLLPSTQPEPQWIPCSKKLPEDGRYLCTYENNEGICVDFGRVINGEWWVMPIAWMPIPEPYKEKKENEI